MLCPWVTVAGRARQYTIPYPMVGLAVIFNAFNIPNGGFQFRHIYGVCSRRGKGRY